jgi:hypothetical protein
LTCSLAKNVPIKTLQYPEWSQYLLTYLTNGLANLDNTPAVTKGFTDVVEDYAARVKRKGKTLKVIRDWHMETRGKEVTATCAYEGACTTAETW